MVDSQDSPEVFLCLELRRDLRVRRKPPLPTLQRERGYYTPRSTANVTSPETPGAAGGFVSFSDRPIPPPNHVEVDPRTAAILARVEPESPFALVQDPDYERDKALVWGIAVGNEPEVGHLAEALQSQFFPAEEHVSGPRPPEITRVEYFRELDARARQEKALAAQREEADRVAAAAREARVDSELRRRQKLANEAAAAIISAEIEEMSEADAEAGKTAAVAAAALQETEQANVAAGLGTSTIATVIETQAAATRGAELVAAGGGDAGLRRRVAQRWLLQEFSRFTQKYR